MGLQVREAGLLSDEHFTVDGTLLEACAGQKSFRPKEGSGDDTHASTTDPDARLYKKGHGKEAKLCFLGHAVADNRHGLLVGASTKLATVDDDSGPAAQVAPSRPTQGRLGLHLHRGGLRQGAHAQAVGERHLICAMFSCTGSATRNPGPNQETSGLPEPDRRLSSLTKRLHSPEEATERRSSANC